MEEMELSTKFAPAERADQSTVLRQYDQFTQDVLLTQILESISMAILILNSNRQLVFANRVLMNVMKVDDIHEILGLRPGEALACTHASDESGGCGTSVFCTHCGAVKAILSSIQGEEDVQECSITGADQRHVLDLRVQASPLDYFEDRFIVFSVTDIADEKRREVLERIFLHDVKNTAGGLQGFTRLLTKVPENELDNFKKMIQELADKLIDEIDSYHQLAKAESHRLQVHPNRVSTLGLLIRLKHLYMNHDVARGKRLEVDLMSDDVMMVTDETILARVIGNMTKNALEAIGRDQCVTLSCREEDGQVRFKVHNPGVIPEEAQLQIFQRSFSTKGTGRGVGTYSIRLLSEEYLKGEVGFTSMENEGTTFYGVYPATLHENQQES